MANRGMLPKFRPSAVDGREAPARPVIRPVKAMALPPPPSPPSPGRRRGAELNDLERATSTALLPDPRSLASTVNNAQRAIQPNMTMRLSSRADDETQARQLDDELLATARQISRRDRDLDVAYESLPSLEVATPFDAYEDRFGDQATSPRVDDRRSGLDAREYSGRTLPHEPPRRSLESGKQLRDEVYDAPPVTQAFPPSNEESGPRQRPRRSSAHLYENERESERHLDRHASERAQRVESFEESRSSSDERRESYKMPRREAPMAAPTRREESVAARRPPPAELAERGDEQDQRVPSAPPAAGPSDENVVPAGFVVGVQPLRTAAAPMPMYYQPAPTNALAPRTPHPGVGYAPVVVPHPPLGTSARMAAAPMHLRPSTAPLTGPQMMMTAATAAETDRRSKIGRFAFFVFGAAFGIFFAFFATGFAPQLGKKDDTTAQKPTPVAMPTLTAPPPVAQPLPLPIAQPLPLPLPIAQPPIVLAPPQPTVVAASPVAAPPPAVAAAPRAPRTTTRRAPPPSAPRGDADEAPRASAKSEKSENVGDLLNAGLGP